MGEERKGRGRPRVLTWLKKKTGKVWPSAFKWKRLGLRVSLWDDVVFRVLSVLESFVLLSSLCCFFLCCGCHI